MNLFFESWADIKAFLNRLVAMRCPFCGASGSLVRHGFIYGYVDDRCIDQSGIRARRIRCHPRKGGCGAAPSLRPGDRLFRYCFSTKLAWAFLRELLRGRSVKAA